MAALATAFAPVLLVALLAAPRVGWIARQQVGLQLVPAVVYEITLRGLGVRNAAGIRSDPSPSVDARIRAALARHPDDAGSQVAMAWLEPNANSERIVAHLRAQLPRRAADPALHAHILRFYAMGRIRVRRPEEHEWSHAGFAAPAQKTPAPDPALLASYLESARAGERLDPDNAYFPMMECLGLFSAYRDREALAALHRAAGKTRWNDYAAGEAVARQRAVEEAFGRQSAMVLVGAQACVLFPHYASVRSGVRVSVSIASALERRGEFRAALAIRRESMRTGALMRSTSSSAIGTLVGCALTELAIDTPGQSASEAGSQPSGPEARARREAANLNEMVRRGQIQDAAWAQDQLFASAAARDAVQRGLPRTPLGAVAAGGLARQWIIGCVLAAHIVWLLLVAGLAGAAHRWRKAAWLRWSVPVVGLVALLWLSGRAAGLASVFVGVTRALEVMVGAGAASKAADPTMAARAFVMCGVMAVPLVVSGIAAAIALGRDRPLLPSLARTCMVAAAVVNLLYGGVLAQTAGSEERARGDLARMLEGEGRYSAHVAGMSWPEVEPGAAANR